jgi:formylglycine-generating enzyme required for sulfatase activity
VSAFHEGRVSVGRERPGSCCGAARGGPAAPNSAVRDIRLENMVRVPGGSFLMGSDKFYREERPVRRASLEAFWIDVHPVTNAQFRQFVAATAYITLAERSPDPALYPDAAPELLVPGSLVFNKPERPVRLSDHRAWWAYVPGANWRHPEGPESSLCDRDDHPVVHVAYEDACAYAAWAGKALPSEAEWEFAARGGLDGATYPWGEEFAPAGKLMANIWIGRFPNESAKPAGTERTTSVKSFPANAYGLYDVVGNVWEWTRSPFEARAGERSAGSCCAPGFADTAHFRRVVKGGSHLCAPNYCLRYRPAARQGQTLDTTTGHIGFRCVVRA